MIIGRISTDTDSKGHQILAKQRNYTYNHIILLDRQKVILNTTNEKTFNTTVIL